MKKQSDRECAVYDGSCEIRLDSSSELFERIVGIN